MPRQSLLCVLFFLVARDRRDITGDGLSTVPKRYWKASPLGNIQNMHLYSEEVDVVAGKSAGTTIDDGLLTVAVERVGVNFADVWTVLGLYKAAPKDGCVPGLEFCGTVIGGSEGDCNLIGKTVFGFTRFGGFSSVVTVPRDWVRELPPDWSVDEGAAFLVQGLTAWHALNSLVGLPERCRIAKEEGLDPPTVLIHSAAGGVGLAAVDICLKLGARTSGTVSSQFKADFLANRTGLPADQICIRPKRSRDLPQAFSQVLGPSGEADICLDGIGGSCFRASLDLLSTGGRIVHFGGATYAAPGDTPQWANIIPKWIRRPRVDPGSLVSRSRGVVGFNLIFLTDRTVQLNRELDGLLGLELSRRPHIGKVFDFDDAPDALRYLQGGTSVGKILLKLPKVDTHL